MRFLGIDYGTKRVGVAISDENSSMAFPKEILENNPSIFDQLGDIINKEKVGGLVVGESVDFSGKLNVLSGRIELFILELTNRFGLPVHKQKEFLTSVEARRYNNLGGQARRSNAHSRIKQIKSGRVDASAAALILQRYLDKINKP